jgi:two-component system cell cycle sensor histidine kinase/response regulator CckA
VLFPASNISPKNTAVSDVEAAGENPRGGDRPPETILVVDDEEAIRNSVKLLLEATGFHVVTAADGPEALQIFRTRPADFSAVLLDLTMPHMSGASVFRELRAMRSDIPILVTSGYSEQEAVRHFQNSGLAGFIQKPYRSHQLRAKLQEVLHSVPQQRPETTAP